MSTPAASSVLKARLQGLCPQGSSIVAGGVTSPRGFRAAGVAAGIKRAGPDLAVIASDLPCQAAGVFTQNQVCAAPVALCRDLLYGEARDPGPYRAVVVNAGNANACTGAAGIDVAHAMVEALQETLHLPPASCLVASTGVIGQQLPLDRAVSGIRLACAALSPSGGSAAARAIMTTDTVPKEVAVRVSLGQGDVVIGGMSKGSGMIHPDMATMLGFITTDVSIGASHAELRQLLREVSDSTFNMLTVDNDTSTNDSLFLLANGASGVGVLPGTDDWTVFVSALTFVARYLAMLMAADGEGATKLLEVVVTGGHERSSLRQLAMSVAMSSLVKTAIFGEDANWGRILAAVGYSGVLVSPEKVSIRLGDLQVCAAGAGLPFDEAEAKRILGDDWVTIDIHLGDGQNAVTVWSCDLTYDYVKINGSYRS